MIIWRLQQELHFVPPPLYAPLESATREFLNCSILPFSIVFPGRNRLSMKDWFEPLTAAERLHFRSD
jgi:hypothetical protein